MLAAGNNNTFHINKGLEAKDYDKLDNYNMQIKVNLSGSLNTYT